MGGAFLQGGFFVADVAGQLDEEIFLGRETRPHREILFRRPAEPGLPDLRVGLGIEAGAGAEAELVISRIVMASKVMGSLRCGSHRESRGPRGAAGAEALVLGQEGLLPFLGHVGGAPPAGGEFQGAADVAGERAGTSTTTRAMSRRTS